jgi:hypothetical protein
MAHIPVGVTYEASRSGSVEFPFTCSQCAYRSTAWVRARGEGSGTAVAFLGKDSAKERAANAAANDLDANARVMATAGKCPGCGHRELRELNGFRRATLVISLGWIVALTILFSIGNVNTSFSMALGIGVGVATYVRKRWVWAEVDERVQVLRSEAEVKARAAKLGPSESWTLALLWRPSAEAVVTAPFFGLVRLGVIDVHDGQATWVTEAETVDARSEVVERARKNLAQRSAAPLREVEPGVWQGEWGDWFAASRLAVPELFSALSTKGAVVAFVPSESTLFVAGAEDAPGLARAAVLAASHAQDVIAKQGRAGAFTALPWRLQRGQWSPWSGPDALQPELARLTEVVGPHGWKQG